MSQIENRLNLNDLDNLLKNVDPDLFIVTLNRLLKEEENKQHNKRNPTPQRTVHSRWSDPTPSRPAEKPRTGGHYSLVGKMPWGAEEFSFMGYSNGGGANGVDCGLIALKKAFDVLPNRPADLVDTFFAGSHGDIREELVQMFLNAEEQLQLHMANQYLLSTANESADSLRTQTVHKLRTEMLNWQTLVQYIQWKFPGRVNAVVWKQQPTGDVVVYEGGTRIDPNLPILHVVHYNSMHFEALSCAEADRVECAIKGRVDDAVEYMIEADYNLVSLFVARHPAVDGRMLLRLADEPTVYECAENHAVMAQLSKMTPTNVGVSYSFNYHATEPVSDSMVAMIEEFVLVQALDRMAV